MPKTPKLSPSDHIRLNALFDDAKGKRLAYAKALEQHRANALSVALLKEDALKAGEEYIQTYQSFGLNRQREWQRNRSSRGLCRFCGEEAVPETSMCKVHHEKNGKYLSKATKARAKKVVQP